MSWFRAGCLSSLAVLSGCYWPGRSISALPPPPHVPVVPVRASVTRNVILVVLDGVRWQDVFYGVDPVMQLDAPATPTLRAPELVPALFSLMSRGVGLGAAPTGSGLDRVRGAVYVPAPYISLPSYRTIVTGGDPPEDCIDNNSSGCWASNSPGRFLWTEVAATGATVGAVGSWPTLRHLVAPGELRVDYSFGYGADDSSQTLLVGDYASMRAHAQSLGSAPANHGTYRRDEETIALALKYVEDRQPRFLFVSLGDADEYGHASVGTSRYAEYIAALRRQDQFIRSLVAVLQAKGQYGEETAVIVTADHGRNRGFTRHVERAGGAEDQYAGRSWLVAAGGGIRAQGLVLDHPPYQLRDLAASIRAMLSMAGVSRAPIEELR